uniref:Uncharacterized protein n=1 Tax=Chlorobium phaeobacteroides (strain BS1) TaxID=331678 RepID=B3EPT2_CHLPB
MRLIAVTVSAPLIRSGSFTVIDRFENLQVQYNETPELVELALHFESV